jgi:uncharacterized membrane protein YphA (DoxX/SURF4 family)
MNKSPDPSDIQPRLRYPLFILRLATGLFFLQWGIEKLIKPETTASIFDHFYGLNLSLFMSQALGGLEVLLALSILAGFKRRLVYGAAFVMHLGSTLSTWAQLTQPYSGNNHLFAAAVPLLAALWLLFRMADYDDVMSLDAR